MNDREFKELLREELPYPALTPEAEKAFTRVCRQVEEKQRAGAGHAARQRDQTGPWEEARPVKAQKASISGRILKFGLSSAAVLLLCVSFLGLAFPAVAENLPGLGPVFQGLRYKFGLGGNLSTYRGLGEQIQLTAEQEGYQVTVAEAYSEGENIFLSLRLDTQREEILEAEWLSTYFLYDEEIWGYQKDYTVTVNGQLAKMSKEIVFQKAEDHYECAAVILLPEKVKNGTKLQVELTIEALRGLKKETDYRFDTMPDVEITTPLSLSFQVTANTSRNEKGEFLLEKDAVTLLGYESTPSYFKVELAYPLPTRVMYSGMPCYGTVTAVTEDGTELAPYLEGSEMSPTLEEEALLGEEGHHIAAFSGVPEGTKKVTVTLYNLKGAYDIWIDGGSMGSYVFGEFTLDLENGTAEATSQYVQKGYELFPVEEYVEEQKKGPQFQNHMFDQRISCGYEETGEPNCTFSFYTDTAEPLPWGAEVYLDGSLVGTVSLNLGEKKGASKSVTWEEGTVVWEDLQNREGSWHYHETIRGAYYLNFCYGNLLEDDEDIWPEDHSLSLRVFHQETGETIFTFGDGRELPAYGVF